MKRVAWIVGILASTVSFSALASSTPLELRHDTVVASTPDASIGVGWKLVAVAAIVAGAALWAYRRSRGGAATVAPELRVVSRVALGARSEIIVVAVGEQRFLLGATPSSIRHIADVERESAREEIEAPRSIVTKDVSSRFRSLIEDALEDAPPARKDREPVETQATNLLVLRRRP